MKVKTKILHNHNNPCVLKYQKIISLKDDFKLFILLLKQACIQATTHPCYNIKMYAMISKPQNSLNHNWIQQINGVRQFIQMNEKFRIQNVHQLNVASSTTGYNNPYN